MKKILVLSPHSDDAVLSCADHILDWGKKGYEITVCTIFTKYGEGNISSDAKKFMFQSGYKNNVSFEHARANEEISALGYLKVKYISLNYIDGAFRKNKKKILYKSFHEIFNGEVDKSDFTIIKKLSIFLASSSADYDYIISPLAIGRHIDHRIVKISAKLSITSPKILYYCDVPYSFKLFNWNFSLLKSILFHNKSIKMTSTKKRNAINYYMSQSNVLFTNFNSLFFNTNVQFYPEIIINMNKSKGLL